MKNVVFCNNNPGYVTAGLWQSFTKLLVRDMQSDEPRIGGLVALESGGLLSIYRNKLVERALQETDCEWLWIVDSDIVLEDDTLTRLLEIADPEQVAILGALYFLRLDDGMYPAILGRKLHADGVIKVTPIFRADEEWPRDQLVPVDAVGLGCTLIHRSVFEKLEAEHGYPEPWFAQERDGNVVQGEDISFCRRAVKLGFQPHVHTGIEVGHIKPIVLGSATLGVADA